MANGKIIGQFISTDSVNSPIILLSNNIALKSRNAANTANLDLIKVDSSDALVFLRAASMGGFILSNIGTAVSATDAINKSYADNIQNLGLFAIYFEKNGATSNTFLSVTASAITSNVSSYIAPFAMQIISISCQNSVNEAGTVLELHTATSDSNVTTRQIAITAAEFRGFQVANFAPINIAAGTRIAAYCAAGGTTPSNVNVILLCRISSTNTINSSFNLAGNLIRTASGGQTITV